MVRLDDLPGLESAKRLVAKLLGNEAIHAVLFYGSPGAGQDRLAQVLAAAWLCQNPGSRGACGECQACLTFERGTNPDVQTIGPYGPGNQIKLPAIVKTKRPTEEPPCIPIRDYGRTGPLYSRKKVVVLVQAERMNEEAYNALLKQLEEPHAFMKFILVTASIGRIAETIRSRCLSVACEQADPKEVAESLGSLIDVYTAAPHLLSRFETNREAFDAMEAFVIRLGSLPAGAALRLADDFQGLSGEIGEDDRPGRVGLAESLELLAILVARHHPGRPDWIAAILETHRRVIGNVSGRTALDALFTQLVA